MNDQPPTAIKYEVAQHRDQSVIFIRFGYAPDLIERVKKLTGVRWSKSQKAWYVLDTPHYRSLFKISIQPVGKEVIAQIDAVNRPALLRLIETLELKAYSPSTIQTYRNEFAQLLYILKDNHVDALTPERLRDYFLDRKSVV